MTQPRILAVDDDPLTLRLEQKVLGLAGYDVVASPSAIEALVQVRTRLFDLALLDIHMPGMSGLELLREIKQHDPSIEVVITTGYPEVKTAIEALKEGAFDYLTKPLDLDELRLCLSRAMERRFLRSEVCTLRSQLGERLATKELVSASPQMLRLKQMMAHVATSDSAVLIQGESGTGKELVAAGIHRLSPRSNKPFIPINCGAIPPELMESELFGHVRGAFTGAIAEAMGLFRSAHEGTLFLDEIGELPLALQAKLLRVLQEKEVRPVGSTKTYQVDIRIIAATNRDLEQAVQNGLFREDLFYRVNVVLLKIPALRERKEDIPALIAHFIKAFNKTFGRQVQGIEPEALAFLTAFEFRGNVRQLENLLERAYVLGNGNRLTLADFPTLRSFQEQRPPDPASNGDYLPTLIEAERDLIQKALRYYEGDRKQAAQTLGMSPRTLYRRLREFGLSDARE